MIKKYPTLYIVYAVIVAGLFSVPFFTTESYVFHIFCLIGINIIFACSLNIILNIGELNLAHAAFMGIGAYTSTLIMVKFALSFWVAMPIAMVVAAIISLAIGLLTLRFKGAYFLLFTFLFAELVRVLLSNFWIDFFGGVPGLTNIPRPSIVIPGFFSTKFNSNIEFYYLIMIILLLTIFVMRRMDMSRLGMLFRAISQSESLAESTGISTMKFKILGCAIGCGFAGLAGSLYAHFVGIITPHDFSIHAVLAPVAYVVVGGMGSVYGPVLGTTALMILSHFYLRQFGLYELLIYGLIIIVIIRFMPEGLISIPRSLSHWYGRLSKKE